MNYIASRVKFKDVDGGCEISGKLYIVDYNLDPEYINDGVLDISYHKLFTVDGEIAPYILAFDRIECEEPQEWSDEYDADNPYVLEFV